MLFRRALGKVKNLGKKEREVGDDDGPCGVERRAFSWSIAKTVSCSRSTLRKRRGFTGWVNASADRVERSTQSGVAARGAICDGVLIRQGKIATAFPLPNLAVGTLWLATLGGMSVRGNGLGKKSSLQGQNAGFSRCVPTFSTFGSRVLGDKTTCLFQVGHDEDAIGATCYTPPSPS